MARQYVFLVHGVGRHKRDVWAEPWKTALFEAFRQYAPFSGKTDNQIEDSDLRIVPISYDAKFNTYKERWGKLAEALVDTEVVGSSTLKRALQWVADNEDEETIKIIFWDYVLDALLWFTLPFARASVIAHVAKQIATGLGEMNRENQGENASHVVAHSLGTSVVHDALISLKTWSKEESEGLFDPQRHKWRTVFMVSNVSRLLENWMDIAGEVPLDEYKAYGSALMPNGRGSIARSYFNIRHRIDPITWPRHFRPANWSSSKYSDIEIVRYDELKEVHDFEHYISNPRVHVPLLRQVMGNNRLCTGEEVRQAMKRFEREFPHSGDDVLSVTRSLIPSGNRDLALNPRQIAQFLLSAFKELG